MIAEVKAHGSGGEGLRSTIAHMRANPGKVHVLGLVGPDGEQVLETVMPEDIDFVCEALEKVLNNS